MDDIERRREMRRQKREEMRLEAERLASQRNEDDEEEAARERRRRARQERMRQKDEDGTPSHITEKVEVHVQNSVTEETRSVTTADTTTDLDDEAAFLERLAKREERRQKRLQEALDRQKELEPTTYEKPTPIRRREENEENEFTVKDEKVESRQGRYEIEEVETKTYERNDRWQRDEEEEEVADDEKSLPSYYKKEIEEEKALREKEENEAREREERAAWEREEKAAREREEKVAREREEKAAREREEKAAREREAKLAKEREERAAREREEKAAREKEEKAAREREEKVTKKDDIKFIRDHKQEIQEPKQQNGEDYHEGIADEHKRPERILSRSSMKSTTETEEADDVSRLEAEKKLEMLRRRRDETETEEFERLKQKQQEAAMELEELKRKREERKKILEEEEQRRKQEEAEKKAKEEEEKRRMKEEIERRRAEAAEKRQKITEDGVSTDCKKPFTCVSPRASSLKIGERAEFLNRSAQKSSSVKTSHPPAVVVSKIDSRLEQYTSAIEGTKATKPGKPSATDLPVPAEGVRNIKSMWEKGNVFGSPGNPSTPNKETAGLKVGISSRINEWLNKTPESSKSPSAKPSDLRPGDVSGKRNIWENKASSTEKSSPSPKLFTEK